MVNGVGKILRTVGTDNRHTSSIIIMTCIEYSQLTRCPVCLFDIMYFVHDQLQQ